MDFCCTLVEARIFRDRGPPRLAPDESGERSEPVGWKCCACRLRVEHGASAPSLPPPLRRQGQLRGTLLTGPALLEEHLLARALRCLVDSRLVRPPLAHPDVLLVLRGGARGSSPLESSNGLAHGATSAGHGRELVAPGASRRPHPGLVDAVHTRSADVMGVRGV